MVELGVHIHHALATCHMVSQVSTDSKNREDSTSTFGDQHRTDPPPFSAPVARCARLIGWLQVPAEACKHQVQGHGSQKLWIHGDGEDAAFTSGGSRSYFFCIEHARAPVENNAHLLGILAYI